MVSPPTTQPSQRNICASPLVLTNPSQPASQQAIHPSSNHRPIHPRSSSFPHTTTNKPSSSSKTTQTHTHTPTHTHTEKANHSNHHCTYSTIGSRVDSTVVVVVVVVVGRWMLLSSRLVVPVFRSEPKTVIPLDMLHNRNNDYPRTV